MYLFIQVKMIAINDSYEINKYTKYKYILIVIGF